jgi:1,2-diacylglycerol 3-alpha-glucosyltransferase
MNVGLFADCYAPTVSGVVTSLLQLKQGLEQRGHKVVVFTAATPGYAERDGSLRPFPSLPFNRASGFRLALVNPQAVLRMVRDEALEVIHTHTEYSLGWAGKHAARRLGLAFVHTAHTFHEAYRHYLPLGRAMPVGLVHLYLRRFLANCDMLICPSQKARDYFSTWLPDLSAVVIGNGLSHTHFQPHPLGREQEAQTRLSLGIRPTDQVILYAGRLAREKRVSELLNVLAPLLQAHPQTKGLFVGSGPASADLVAEVERHRLHGQVILAGEVNWSQMYRFYSLAQVFVTASLSEMHPMTLIEASLCGLPVVARRDPAYADLVRNGYNGYLVASDQAIAARAWEILCSEGKRQELSKNAIALSREFSAEAHVRKLEDLYQQLVGRKFA